MTLDGMTLVADRFIRCRDGTVRDLATGELVTLVEIGVTDVAEQIALRDRCLARLDTVVDFGLVGESQWIEAYAIGRANDAAGGAVGEVVGEVVGEAAMEPVINPAIDAIAATLDELGSRDVRRLYVKAPDSARLDTFHHIVAREVRARGFIPLATSVVVSCPEIARLLTGRSIVLLGDARFGSSAMDFSLFSGVDGFGESVGTIARAIALLHRAASFVAALVARVRDHVDVAALRLLPSPPAAVAVAAARRSHVEVDVAVRPRIESGIESQRAPISVVQPARDVSYADPDLPPLFPQTFQVARVAEAATLACDECAADEYATDDHGSGDHASEAPALVYVPRLQDLIVTSDGAVVDRTTGEVLSDRIGPGVRSFADTQFPPARADAEPQLDESRESDQATESAASGGSTGLPESPESTGSTETRGSTESASAAVAVRLEAAQSEAKPAPAPEPEPEPDMRYPPLRLVERRIRSEPAGDGPADDEAVGMLQIPVVTTMVSGYGNVADGLVARGRWAAASRALRAELAAHERRKHHATAARTSIALGRLHLAMGEVGQATRWFNRAIELAASPSSAAAAAAGARAGAGVGSGAEVGSGVGAEVGVGVGMGGEGGAWAWAGAWPGRGPRRRDSDDARLIGEALRWSGIAALDDADLERSEQLLRQALAAIGPDADPHQILAIELSLARCLFWQGRIREIVLPSADALTVLSARNPLSVRRSSASSGDGPRFNATTWATPWGTATAAPSHEIPSAGERGDFRSGREQRGFAEKRRAPGRIASDRASGAATHDALAVAILRVERWRRASRLALFEGDLSRAGDAIMRACRIARGDDEHDVRSGGCRIEDPTRARARDRKAISASNSGAGAGAVGGHAEERRIREALRASCHLDAARLQFAIGDMATGDAHLRAGLALTRVPARTARAQLLQLARLKSDRTSEGRRRFEKLSAAMRQPRMSKLVRVRARYLVDPRSRRATELVTFLNRHGDTALAGHESDRVVRPGGSPMLEAFQDVLRICHETPDDLTALARVSAYLRDRLRAATVAIYGMPAGSAHRVGDRERTRSADEPRTGLADEALGLIDPVHCAAAVVRFAVAGSTRIVSPELASRAIDSGLAIPPTYRADALDAAAPVRYGGASIGAIVVRWSIDATLDHMHAAALISAAAAAVSPHLRAALDREWPEAFIGAGAGAGAGGGVGAGAGVGGGGGAGAGAGADADGGGRRGSGSARASAGAEARGRAATGPSTEAPGDGAARGGTAAATAATASAVASGGRSAAVSRRTLGLLGISEAIESLRHTITRVSSAPFHVLIEGESGSGKELVARALHQYGPRRHRRFCAVNCAALSDELLEAELFGHTRGAFTGALTERAGLFEEADGGTLFLDEIGELSPRGQAKLLRVIQDGETRRIGENLPRRVDTRIVAATNRALRDEAAAGRFRADLLYRLDVIHIAVPPLRARPEDVTLLARAFWEEAIARLGSRATLDPGTLVALARYHWPGNVRELHNVIVALAVHAPPRGRVTPSQLPASFEARKSNAPPGDASVGAVSGESGPEPLAPEGSLEDAKRAFESRYVRAALAKAGGSPSRAARSLGLTRQGLAKLIARLGLDDERPGEPARAPRPRSTRKERAPP